MSRSSRLTALLLIGTLLSTPAFAARNQINNLKDGGDKYTAVKPVPPLVDVDSDMGDVLSALSGLHPKPIESLTPDEARKQPTVADAVKVVEQKKNIAAPYQDVTTSKVMIPTIDGSSIEGRVYKPSNLLSGSPAPVVVYYHGGGFVIATNAVYDATPRTIAQLTGAIVVSVEYRKAPEFKFPTSHEDAFSAYQWVLANASKWGGDPNRVAVMGESAGGNLAINVSIAARDNRVTLPVYQVLVYPVAGNDMMTKSYIENEDAKPLNKAMMKWFFKHEIRDDKDKGDPRLDLVNKADLHGLPPTTVITAQIDPLRTEGTELAEKLKATGIPVDEKNYEGVTHEFFGMGTVVKKAAEAETLVANDLRKAFAEPVTP